MSTPDDTLPRMAAAAEWLAGELHAVLLPPCTCGERARGQGLVDVSAELMRDGASGEVALSHWCATHRARYFASQLARELRNLSALRRRK